MSKLIIELKKMGSAYEFMILNNEQFKAVCGASFFAKTLAIGKFNLQFEHLKTIQSLSKLCFGVKHIFSEFFLFSHSTCCTNFLNRFSLNSQ